MPMPESAKRTASELTATVGRRPAQQGTHKKRRREQQSKRPPRPSIMWRDVEPPRQNSIPKGLLKAGGWLKKKGGVTDEPVQGGGATGNYTRAQRWKPALDGYFQAGG